MEFACLMAKHAPQFPLTQLQRVMRLSSTINWLATEDCNTGLTDWKRAKYHRFRNKVRDLCAEYGCGVKFSGDPRGATVKIVVPDGYTNDWGGEGICVPGS